MIEEEVIVRTGPEEPSSQTFHAWGQIKAVIVGSHRIV